MENNNRKNFPKVKLSDGVLKKVAEELGVSPRMAWYRLHKSKNPITRKEALQLALKYQQIIDKAEAEKQRLIEELSAQG